MIIPRNILLYIIFGLVAMIIVLGIAGDYILNIFKDVGCIGFDYTVGNVPFLGQKLAEQVCG
ncbi:MAG: hypothetical protein ACTSPB_04595 [Candidatus Thorarchaeota archaeon]